MTRAKSNVETDDEWLMNSLFPLKTWQWHDGARE